MAAAGREVSTPRGPARVQEHRSPVTRPRATLVLGHGAGGGVGARDLQALAHVLPPAGVDVLLVEQPWVVAGRRVAPAPPLLDEAWCAVLPALPVRGSLVLGGRSAGARVACRTATALGAAAVVALAFPLHPPGRPDRSRVDEAAGVVRAGLPLLVVQGERDAFGTATDVRAALPGAAVATVPWADHAFAVPSGAPLTREEAVDLVVEAVRGWTVGGREWPAGWARLPHHARGAVRPVRGARGAPRTLAGDERAGSGTR